MAERSKATSEEKAGYAMYLDSLKDAIRQAEENYLIGLQEVHERSNLTDADLGEITGVPPKTAHYQRRKGVQARDRRIGQGAGGSGEQ